METTETTQQAPTAGHAGAPHPAAAPAQGAPAKPKKDNKRFVLIIGLAVLLGAGFLAYVMLNPVLSTDNAMVERTKATVSTKMMGMISRINVDEGQFVTKGALLVELDSAELQAQKDQAEANLAIAQESIKSSQNNLDKVQADFNRARSQYRNNNISTEAYEHSEKAFQSSQIDYNLALKKVQVAKAQLDLIDATIANSRLAASFDAVVAKKWMNAGDVMQPSQPVLTLYDSHRATVTANFEETKIARIKPGQAVTVRVDAYPGVEFRGHVSEVGTNTGNQFSLIPVNNAAGNFTKVTQRIPVKIAIDGSTDLQDPAAKRLMPGMSAEVEIRL